MKRGVTIAGKLYMIDERLLDRRHYNTDDPAQLDRLGELLSKVFELERKKLQSYKALWQMYLVDCKRLGVKPRDRVIVR